MVYWKIPARPCCLVSFFSFWQKPKSLTVQLQMYNILIPQRTDIQQIIIINNFKLFQLGGSQRITMQMPSGPKIRFNWNNYHGGDLCTPISSKATQPPVVITWQSRSSCSRGTTAKMSSLKSVASSILLLSPTITPFSTARYPPV